MNVLKRTRKKVDEEIQKPEKVILENIEEDTKEANPEAKNEEPEQNPFAPEPYVRNVPKSGSYSIKGKVKGAIN